MQAIKGFVVFMGLLIVAGLALVVYALMTRVSDGAGSSDGFDATTVPLPAGCTLAEARIDYAWGGTLAITRNRLPGFGRLGPGLFYAQGFSGHGVALTTLAGKLIAEAVAGSAERFDVFARLPQPGFPGGTLLRWPGMVAGMLYYALRDRL